MRRRRIIAAACGLGLAIAACGGDGEPDTSGDTTAPTVVEASTAEPVASSDGDLSENLPTGSDDPHAGEASESAVPDDVAVPALLQFSAPLVGGGEIDAANLSGRPTVFWFWAPT